MVSALVWLVWFPKSSGILCFISFFIGTQLTNTVLLFLKESFKERPWTQKRMSENWHVFFYRFGVFFLLSVRFGETVLILYIELRYLI